MGECRRCECSTCLNKTCSCSIKEKGKCGFRNVVRCIDFISPDPTLNLDICSYKESDLNYIDEELSQF